MEKSGENEVSGVIQSLTLNIFCVCSEPAHFLFFCFPEGVGLVYPAAS